MLNMGIAFYTLVYRHDGKFQPIPVLDSDVSPLRSFGFNIYVPKACIAAALRAKATLVMANDIIQIKQDGKRIFGAHWQIFNNVIRVKDLDCANRLIVELNESLGASNASQMC